MCLYNFHTHSFCYMYIPGILYAYGWQLGKTSTIGLGSIIFAQKSRGLKRASPLTGSCPKYQYCRNKGVFVSAVSDSLARLLMSHKSKPF